MGVSYVGETKPKTIIVPKTGERELELSGDVTTLSSFYLLLPHCHLLDRDLESPVYFGSILGRLGLSFRRTRLDLPQMACIYSHKLRHHPQSQ